MFGTRMLLIYPAVVFNADVPHLGPRVGGEGNPHVKSKIFLPPALPGEILLACRGQWAVPNGACMLCRGMRVSRFESQIACAKNRADRCLTISYVAIFSFSHISVLGILFILCTYVY